MDERFRTGSRSGEDTLDAKDLTARGWTRAMVPELLGDADRREPLPHFVRRPGKRLYLRARVEAVEGTPAFRDRFERSLPRRKLAPEVVAEVLARSRALEAEASRASGTAGGDRARDQDVDPAHSGAPAIDEADLGQRGDPAFVRRVQQYRRRLGILDRESAALTPPGMGVPAEATFVIRLSYVAAEELDEMFYLEALPEALFELWSDANSGERVVARQTLPGRDPASAAYALLEAVVLARLANRSYDFEEGGLLSEADWLGIRTRMEERRIAAGPVDDRELHAVALRLKLFPAPEDADAGLFVAQCPRHPHTLELDLPRQQWRCPACATGGRPDELEQFALRVR
jgi:hypothetical protein